MRHITNIANYVAKRARKIEKELRLKKISRETARDKIETSIYQAVWLTTWLWDRWYSTLLAAAILRMDPTYQFWQYVLPGFDFPEIYLFISDMK